MRNFLTIDVEDYYQVSGLSDVSPFADWINRESRSERNVDILLETLDNIKGTFFMLGWEAERNPHLIKKIIGGGHEIASHGYSHRMLSEITRDEFRSDLHRSIKYLEDLSGGSILGYRAPSFSITNENLWTFEVMAESGIKYDSSVVPVKRRRGGIAGAETRPYAIATSYGDLWEFPLAVADVKGKKIPLAGGGFFRLFPYRFTKRKIEELNAQGIPVVVYLHPWEFDPQQPRLKSFFSRNGFNHYVNISKTLSKFKRLIKDFEFTCFREYIDSNNIKGQS